MTLSFRVARSTVQGTETEEGAEEPAVIPRRSNPIADSIIQPRHKAIFGIRDERHERLVTGLDKREILELIMELEA
jgi:hypothetical protein